MNKKLIAIIGPAGVGKTTIIKELEKQIKINNPQIKIDCLFEKEKYPFLDNQYNNKNKWAFITQIDFLTLRVRELYSKYSFNKSELIITDRLYLDDYLYFSSFYQDKTINKKENKCYNLLFEKYKQMFKEEEIIFDYVFVLKADFNLILKRLKIRNKSEAEINKNEIYWKKHYDLYFNDSTHLDLIKNNVKNVNIINNNRSINETAEEIINIINL